MALRDSDRPFFVNFNQLGNEAIYAAKAGIEYAKKNNFFPIYMDDKSLQIARFLARGTDHYDRFHPYVHDPSGLGQFELIDLNSTAGYLLIAQRASEYAANRYGSLRFSPELLAQKTEVIHTVDNSRDDAVDSWTQKRVRRPESRYCTVRHSCRRTPRRQGHWRRLCPGSSRRGFQAGRWERH